MKEILLVDMDGVLVDIYTTFFKLHEQETGQKLNLKDIAGLLEEEAFKNQRKWVSLPGFFRDLPVMPGSREALHKLNDRYKVIVVSLATEFPFCLTDKQLWMHDNFPFISWKQLVFCGDKNIVKADIMIDDHFKNLDHFDGLTILFTQPHNMLIKDTRHKRVDSWEEIEKLLI
ncbi:MAG TPA: 5'(3')-deoxyribonucleotidase [Bacteroidales bacterium]|jgi:5'-nucleotidase|nr:5'(3')-deoxyribonucleotidase [Bacteroidales bacterium]HBZ22724.1 5'(3')-deoxyribonucleotidase [Bacteroidales bacterium]